MNWARFACPSATQRARVGEHLLDVVSDAKHEIEKVAVAALGVLAADPKQAGGVQSVLTQLRASTSDAQREGLVRALELGVDPTTNKALVAELYHASSNTHDAPSAAGPLDGPGLLAALEHGNARRRSTRASGPRAGESS